MVANPTPNPSIETRNLVIPWVRREARLTSGNGKGNSSRPSSLVALQHAVQVNALVFHSGTASAKMLTHIPV